MKRRFSWLKLARPAGLANFNQENRLFTDLGGNGDSQYDFVDAVADGTATGIELDLDLWLLALEENFRCIRYFDRQILDVKLFNTEDGLSSARLRY